MSDDLPPDIKRSLEDAERVMKAVENALEAGGVHVEELTVAADAGGNVAIFGVASSADAVQRADAIARAVPGVKVLSNSMLVQ